MGNHWENDVLERPIANPERPGRGKQTYATPPELLAAVKKKLRISSFFYDLAASAENAVCVSYYTEQTNSLIQMWATPEKEWNWLNPPYGHLKPWVEKAWFERSWGNQAVLVPAAVGSNWWRDWVHQKAMVWFLNGRITFVGETAPYKKDCAILLYTDKGPRGYGVWPWRAKKLAPCGLDHKGKCNVACGY